MTRPARGVAYTLHQILTELDLKDSPHLGFFLPGRREEYVQTSHLDEAKLLDLPGWADLRWTFVCTTEEWCEIFRIDPADADRLLTMLCTEVSYGHTLYLPAGTTWAGQPA